MKILLFGTTGQLGRELLRTKWPRDARIVSLDRAQADFTVPQSLAIAVREIRPDIVLNAVAYTAVDRAETDEANAQLINTEAPRHIAQACAEIGATLVHISTDYVFDGAKSAAYVETDPTNPAGVYGRTKMQGEVAIRESLESHIIVRTSWVYSAFGANFVKTMLRLAAEREIVRVVADQRGCPTSAEELARGIAALAPQLITRRGVRGTFHLAGSGCATWHGFAEAIFESVALRGGQRPKLEAIATSDYPTPARRPPNSELDSSLFERTFNFRLPPWRVALETVMTELLKTSGSSQVAPS